MANKQEEEPAFQIADQVEFVRREAAAGRHADAVVSVMGSDLLTLYGREEGGLLLHVICPPEEVDSDTSRPAFLITGDSSGALVRIGKSIPGDIAAAALAAIVRRITKGERAGIVPRRVLAEFDLLMAASAGTRLTDEQMVGLMGELEILEVLLRNGGSIDAWTGWDRDSVDFRLPKKLALEVKSTTSADYRRVKIHGLNQLADPVDGSTLYLFLRRFERSPEGRSLPSIIDDLLDMGAPASGLLDRLGKAGYLEIHRADYENKRYHGTQRALRRIDDDHPRLIERMLDGVDTRAVTRIDYTLDLNDSAASDIGGDIEDLLREHLEN